NYDKQIAFFSHVTGAIRGSASSGEDAQNNTIIFYLKKFHWAWFIPIDDEVVSLGLVVLSGITANSRRVLPQYSSPYQPRSRGKNLRHKAGREGACYSQLLLPGSPLLRKRLYLRWGRPSFHRSDLFLWHLGQS